MANIAKKNEQAQAYAQKCRFVAGQCVETATMERMFGFLHKFSYLCAIIALVHMGKRCIVCHKML